MNTETYQITVREQKLEGCNLIKREQLSLCRILAHGESLFANLAQAISNYNISFFNSFLCLELESLGIPEARIGYCFMLLSGPYFVATLSTPVICKKVPRKLQFVICFFISTIGLALMGPSDLLCLPKNEYIIFVGMVLLGFIQALCFI